MNDKIDTIVAGVNRKDEKMWGDFYDRFYAALCVYVSKKLRKECNLLELSVG